MADKPVIKTELVDQDEGFRVWHIWIQRSRYDIVTNRDLPWGPAVHIDCEDDPYYVLTFESRVPLEMFISQLQRFADEAWPPPQEPEHA